MQRTNLPLQAADFVTWFTNRIHFPCSFKESSAVSQEIVLQIEKKKKAWRHQLNFLKSRFLSEKEVQSRHLCFVLSLEESGQLRLLFSNCQSSFILLAADHQRALPTLSLRMPRTMLKSYNNKALEGGSVQLRGKKNREELNTATNSRPIRLCPELVPPQVPSWPRHSGLYGESNLPDGS